MAYDRDLAELIRELTAGEEGVTERPMFGGLAFLVGGNMAVAASREGGLLVRADPREAAELEDGDRVRPMVMGGREMHGWLHVDADAGDRAGDVERWVARGVSYARSLPAKTRRR
ncbi:TfoX/Sxy family protein [Actinomadura verrucosospora]|uniref:RNA methyltransferase TrmH, group 3 n=1 Tax=Actinomadura verrucosospora TaxID=46165 RepID=A0A7D4A6J1_ACTVE|nr:TfoX/Sxy family protein [Actinomadura verrucosospora]QKG23745.1 RNA methyltransferase TrmH, group 3 [Actinomadura verrucosospora]